MPFIKPDITTMKSQLQPVSAHEASRDNSGSHVDCPVRNRDGQTLAGTLRRSASVELCVLCHGLCADRNAVFLPALVETLAAEGLSTYRYDARGEGVSDGAFQYCNYAEQLHDLEDVVGYLRSLGWHLVSLLGHSKAGTIVVQYAALHPVPCVVAISARFFQDQGLEERFGPEVLRKVKEGQAVSLDWPVPGFVLTPEDLQERLSTDMAQVCAQIAPGIRMLFLHGGRDTSVPVRNAQQYAAVLSQSQIKILDEAGHLFDANEHRQTLLSTVCSFVCSMRPSE